MGKRDHHQNKGCCVGKTLAKGDSCGDGQRFPLDCRECLTAALGMQLSVKTDTMLI